MPFNGAGQYAPPGTDFPAVASTLIESAKFNNVINDIATALSTCITKDGQTTVTANLPMNGFRHTGVADGSSATHYASLGQVAVGGAAWAGTSAGSANAQTLAPGVGISAYEAGQRFKFLPGFTNTGALTIAISGLAATAVWSNGGRLSGGEVVIGVEAEIFYDGTRLQLVGGSNLPPMVSQSICEGRLTLTTGVPVTTADVTAAETVYFTPYRGNKIALYTGTGWKLYSFSEVSVDVPDATQMNDVFIYDNAGVLTLDVVAWTNDTTRATALVTQDGVLCKSGALARRYLGSFYSTTAGNGQTEDSAANRFLWNYYNRIDRKMQSALETTDSWTYTIATIRQANANTANQLNFVVGVSEDLVHGLVIVGCSNSGGAQIAVGIGLDVTNAFTSGQISSFLAPNSPRPSPVSWMGYPGIGKHFLSWNEWSTAAGTTTWYGDNGTPTLSQSGMFGTIRN